MVTLADSLVPVAFIQPATVCSPRTVGDIEKYSAYVLEFLAMSSNFE